ncbi:MAG: SIR2 family protein [Methanophagales archaeon]|nr:SIR2 family protein [Methanophagales archaeon]
MEKIKSQFEGIIPAEIINALKANRCILFVGSGLSSQVRRSDGQRLPTWKKFLIELHDWTIANRIKFWGDPGDIKQMIKKDNLLMAAQELQDRLGTAMIGEFLNSVFGDKLVRPSETHRLLPHIPFKAILTTNYDSLIEGAYTIENEGRIPTVFTQEDLLTRPSPLHRDDFFIFKLHGHIDRPSTIILGSRDYQDLLFRTPGYRQFIETLFSTHTVVFIGFGANDPDLNNLLDRLSSIYSRTLGKHYILLPSGTMNPTEKRRFAFDKRLEVVDYIKDQNHTQVSEFLRELLVQVEREPEEVETYIGIEPDQVRIFLSGSFKDKDSLTRIAQFLIENGYSPWLADEQIRPGDVLTQKIPAAIESADCMITVWSKNSIQSDWVRHETESALVRELEGKMFIIPIVIGDIRSPMYLMDKVYLKLEETFDSKDLRPLLESLSGIKKRRR